MSFKVDDDWGYPHFRKPPLRVDLEVDLRGPKRKERVSCEFEGQLWKASAKLPGGLAHAKLNSIAVQSRSSFLPWIMTPDVGHQNEEIEC